MSLDSRYKEIYKETAKIINDIAFMSSSINYYDVMCNNLDISRFVNIENIYCSDINEIKISMLKAYRDKDLQYLYNQYTLLMENIQSGIIFEDDELKMKHLLQMLSLIYNELNSEPESFNSIEEAIEYNKIAHIEKFDTKDELTRTLIENFNFEVSDYRDVNIKEDSIVFIHETFKNDDIYEYSQRHAELNQWINNLLERDSIVIIYLGFNNIFDNMHLYTDFDKKIYKRFDGDKIYLSLFISSNIDSDDEIDF